MLKVFLVEDETVIREGLRDNIFWEEFGYKFVGEAADGEMALPLIRKTKPDVLITDIKMPFMDGLSLSKIVSAELPKTKIIIISGYDDFEYARQAIEVGVEQYLLKPITRMNLKRVLVELKEKIEQTKEPLDYQMQYSTELREYEQFSRRRFFEKLLGGDMPVQEIYEEAARQSIEITAPCYNLMFMYIQEEAGLDKEKLDELTKSQEEIIFFFVRHPEYVFFRWNANTFGILIKGEERLVEEYTEKAIQKITSLCTPYEDSLKWYIAVGNKVERLSLLFDCYQNVNHYLAYRFFIPKVHILREDSLNQYFTDGGEKSIDSVDHKKMDPQIIRDFLIRGEDAQVYDFVDSYLYGIKDALESRMFRDYVLLNIRFAVEGFLESVGVAREEYQGALEQMQPDINMKGSDIKDYFIGLLKLAVEIRDRESQDQSKTILRKASEYIDANYENENLSLNEVAGYVDVSASYFSAIFSQTMQKTFVEYVTEKRMEKAKKLLRTTEQSSGDIALLVGYKDPHYFSFVFKKTQGMSPREYRMRKKNG